LPGIVITVHKMNTGWALRLHFSSISSCC